jgi:hypothetical protein
MAKIVKACLHLLFVNFIEYSTKSTIKSLNTIWQTHTRTNTTTDKQNLNYRKPPTITPWLIYFRKRFLMGLYKGGGLYTGGLIHGRSFVFIVINKSDINKSVINKRVLSSDYWAYIKGLVSHQEFAGSNSCWRPFFGTNRLDDLESVYNLSYI